MSREIGIPVTVMVGKGPDDQDDRIELHVYGAPPDKRQEIRSKLIDLAIEGEEIFPREQIVVFVHSSDVLEESRRSRHDLRRDQDPSPEAAG